MMALTVQRLMCCRRSVSIDGSVPCVHLS